MRYTDFYSDLKEDYPLNWNLETFKSLKSFSKRIKYCNETLQRLAAGSARIAYKIDDEKVLKLAKNRKGIAQNEVEGDRFAQQSYKDIIAKVYERDENYLWIEMELAKKISPKRFSELTDVTVEQLGIYLSIQDALDNGRKNYRTIFPELKQKMDNNEWVQRVYSLCRDLALSYGDFGRISSFGESTRDNKPAVIIIDMGLSESVYSDFYSPKQNKIN